MQSTVFVVDDNPEICELLKDIGRTIHLPVETFHCPEQFLSSCKTDRPGCIVSDVRLPNMSGLEMQSRLKAMGVKLPIIFITGHAEVPLVVKAFKGGAVDFIEKPFNQYEIVASIQHAIKLDQMMRKTGTEKARLEEGLARLTKRERQVLDILIGGRSSKHAAKELGISIKTVDFHRNNILTKMETDSLVELARLMQ